MAKRPMNVGDVTLIEAMSIAICNAIRADHHLEPLRDLNKVEDPAHYRRMAAAALAAYRRERLGH